MLTFGYILKKNWVLGIPQGLLGVRRWVVKQV